MRNRVGVGGTVAFEMTDGQASHGIPNEAGEVAMFS